MLRKILLPVLFFVVLLTSFAFALDVDKDFDLGPLKLGAVWDLQLAEKHLGKLLSENKVNVSPTSLEFNKDGVVVKTAETKNNRPASNFKFKDATFLVIDGKIILISTTGTKMRNSKGLRVGDKYEKLLNTYAISEKTREHLETYMKDPSPEPSFVSMKAENDNQRKKLNFFIDKKTRTICGIVVAVVDVK